MEEGVIIAYDAVEMALGGSSPPPSPLHLYDSNLTAITSASSAADGALPNSLVLRTVIHDKGNTTLHAPSSEAEEEVEFLSLCTNADDDLDDAELAISPFPNNPQSSLHPPPHPSFEEPPWLRRGTHSRNHIYSPLLELHREIVAFCELISPTPEEHQLRSVAIERVSSVIKSIWKQCQVNVFGSFAIGLYLPTSDIDMVILDSGCCDNQSGLKALAKALTKEGVAKNIQVIGRARVPIVKFVETESHISFDVSFDMENGPEAAKFMKDALNAIPPLRPLCLVLKIFLQQRDLNEVYTGGIGSYALLIMLLTYLQTHASKLIRVHLPEQSRLEQNLGVLLVDFLEFYGRSLNVKDVGISCRDGGHFFKKKERGFFDSKKPFMLTVEDPQAPTNDIAKSSFNFQKVRFAFMLAHRQLTNCDDDDFTIEAGLLARVVRVDQKLAARKCLAPPPPDRGKKRPSKNVQKRSKGKKSRQAEEHSLQEKRVYKRRRTSEHPMATWKQEHRKFFNASINTGGNDTKQNHFTYRDMVTPSHMIKRG